MDPPHKSTRFKSDPLRYRKYSKVICNSCSHSRVVELNSINIKSPDPLNPLSPLYPCNLCDCRPPVHKRQCPVCAKGASKESKKARKANLTAKKSTNTVSADDSMSQANYFYENPNYCVSSNTSFYEDANDYPSKSNSKVQEMEMECCYYKEPDLQKSINRRGFETFCIAHVKNILENFILSKVDLIPNLTQTLNNQCAEKATSTVTCKISIRQVPLEICTKCRKKLPTAEQQATLDKQSLEQTNNASVAQTHASESKQKIECLVTSSKAKCNNCEELLQQAQASESKEDTECLDGASKPKCNNYEFANMVCHSGDTSNMIETNSVKFANKLDMDCKNNNSINQIESKEKSKSMDNITNPISGISKPIDYINSSSKVYASQSSSKSLRKTDIDKNTISEAGTKVKYSILKPKCIIPKVCPSNGSNVTGSNNDQSLRKSDSLFKCPEANITITKTETKCHVTNSKSKFDIPKPANKVHSNGSISNVTGTNSEKLCRKSHMVSQCPETKYILIKPEAIERSECQEANSNPKSESYLPAAKVCPNGSSSDVTGTVYQISIKKSDMVSKCPEDKPTIRKIKTNEKKKYQETNSKEKSDNSQPVDKLCPNGSTANVSGSNLEKPSSKSVFKCPETTNTLTETQTKTKLKCQNSYLKPISDSFKLADKERSKRPTFNVSGTDYEKHLIKSHLVCKCHEKKYILRKPETKENTKCLGSNSKTKSYSSQPADKLCANGSTHKMTKTNYEEPKQKSDTVVKSPQTKNALTKTQTKFRCQDSNLTPKSDSSKPGDKERSSGSTSHVTETNYDKHSRKSDMVGKCLQTKNAVTKNQTETKLKCQDTNITPQSDSSKPADKEHSSGSTSNVTKPNYEKPWTKSDMVCKCRKTKNMLRNPEIKDNTKCQVSNLMPKTDTFKSIDKLVPNASTSNVIGTNKENSSSKSKMVSICREDISTNETKIKPKCQGTNSKPKPDILKPIDETHCNGASADMTRRHYEKSSIKSNMISNCTIPMPISDIVKPKSDILKPVDEMHVNGSTFEMTERHYGKSFIKSKMVSNCTTSRPIRDIIKIGSANGSSMTGKNYEKFSTEYESVSKCSETKNTLRKPETKDKASCQNTNSKQKSDICKPVDRICSPNGTRVNATCCEKSSSKPYMISKGPEDKNIITKTEIKEKTICLDTNLKPISNIPKHVDKSRPNGSSSDVTERNCKKFSRKSDCEDRNTLKKTESERQDNNTKPKCDIFKSPNYFPSRTNYEKWAGKSPMVERKNTKTSEPKCGTSNPAVKINVKDYTPNATKTNSAKFSRTSDVVSKPPEDNNLTRKTDSEKKTKHQYTIPKPIVKIPESAGPTSNANMIKLKIVSKPFENSDTKERTKCEDIAFRPNRYILETITKFHEAAGPTSNANMRKSEIVPKQFENSDFKEKTKCQDITLNPSGDIHESANKVRQNTTPKPIVKIPEYAATTSNSIMIKSVIVSKPFVDSDTKERTKYQDTASRPIKDIPEPKCKIPESAGPTSSGNVSKSKMISKPPNDSDTKDRTKFHDITSSTNCDILESVYNICQNTTLKPIVEIPESAGLTSNANMIKFNMFSKSSEDGDSAEKTKCQDITSITICDFSESADKVCAKISVSSVSIRNSTKSLGESMNKLLSQSSALETSEKTKCQAIVSKSNCNIAESSGNDVLCGSKSNCDNTESHENVCPSATMPTVKLKKWAWFRNIIKID